MTRAGSVAALAVALATGAALPIGWSDEASEESRRLSITEVERRLGTGIEIPFSRRPRSDPRSVSCKPHGTRSYKCLVSYSETHASIVTYDVTTSAYEPTPARRAADLRAALGLGYRMYCEGAPPRFGVRCDVAGCEYRIGRAAWMRYDQPAPALHC